MACIDLCKITFSYQDGRMVLNQLSLSIPNGIVSLMGPSGCGKSTILRLIAGLEEPSSGQLKVHSGQSTLKKGDIRYAVQNFDGFPWLTVKENLNVWQTSPTTDNQEINDVLKAVGLSAVADNYPHSLSGGMNKRLALSRCILGNPIVILLDEVFSSLDVSLKKELYDLLLLVRDRTGATILNITHDVREATYLSDHIVILGSSPQTKAIQMKIERSSSNKQFMESTEFQQIEKAIYRHLEMS